MSALTLFDLEPSTGARQPCAHGDRCKHPDHTNGTYDRDEPGWGTYPCHECGTELLRFRHCGHWELHADSWKHLRSHAYQRTPVLMDGRLWIGHPSKVSR